MLSSEEIKSITINLGADKCGIANIDRFSSAPTGFRPTDIWSKSKSVIVFLKKLQSEVDQNPFSYCTPIYSAWIRLG